MSVPMTESDFREPFRAHFDDLWRSPGDGATRVRMPTTSWPRHRRRVTTAIEEDPASAPSGYAQSSASVIGAVLDVVEPDRAGVEVINGLLATRYDLTLSDDAVSAIEALPARQVAFFDLEDPSDIRRISVWVAGDLIHQIEVERKERTRTSTFSHFNARITITAPPGLYERSVDDQ